MNFKPIYDRVLIEVDEAPSETASGIALVSEIKEEIARGTVIAVGSGRLTKNGVSIPLETKVDDRVIFAKHDAAEVTIDEKTYILILESNILAIIEE